VAKWRHYLYIFPLVKVNPKEDSDHTDPHNRVSEPDCDLEERPASSGSEVRDMIDIHQATPSDNIKEERSSCNEKDKGDVSEIPKTKPQMFSVSKVDELLRQLEGKMLSYKMFARDTQSSRSM
jgi:hypothetical protein